MNARRQLTHCWSSFEPPKMLKKTKCMIYPLSESSRQKRNGCLQQSSRKSSCNFEIGVGTWNRAQRLRRTENGQQKQKKSKEKKKTKKKKTPTKIYKQVTQIASQAACSSSSSKEPQTFPASAMAPACLFPDVPRTKIS